MLKLAEGQIFETENGTDAYRIREGRVQIFLVPEEKGQAGRPMYLMDAEEGLTFPGLCFKDSSYITWRFRCKASSDCLIQTVEHGNTAVLRRRFAKAAMLDPRMEDMRLENRMIELYDSRIIREDVFISKSEQDREAIRSETEDTIRSIIERTAQPPQIDLIGEEGGTNESSGYRLRQLLHGLPAGKTAVCCISALGCLIAAVLLGIRMLPGGQDHEAGQILADGQDLAGGAQDPAFAVHMLTEYRMVSAALILTLIYLLLRVLLQWGTQSAASSAGESMQRQAYASVFGAEETFFRKHGRRRAAAAAMETYETIRAFVQRSAAAHCAAVFAAVLALSRIGAAFCGGGDQESFPADTGAHGWICAGSAAAIAAAALILCRRSSMSSAAESRIGQLKMDAEQDVYQFLEQIRKIRLAGAQEHVMNRYFRQVAAGKAAEWQLRKQRIPAILAAAALLAAAFLLLMIGAGRGGMDPSALICNVIWFGLLAGEAVWAAVNAAEAGRERRILDEILEAIGAEPAEASDRAERAGQKREEAAEATEAAAPEDEAADREKEAGDPAAAALQISHVWFAYEDADILKDVSLTVEHGLQIGIAGPSGSGKSTLIQLCAGMERPDRGTIRKASERWACVMQRDQLISGSVLDNIEAGRPGITREHLREILEVTGLAEDLAGMPMGLETMLKDSGEDISAGQKQRILLARALAADPEGLLLDEADSEMEEGDQQRLSAYLREKRITCLMVSHRLSSLRACDRVILLSEGRVAESGDPEKLLQKNERFREFMQHQL